jgi:hypothetical protein
VVDTRHAYPQRRRDLGAAKPGDMERRNLPAPLRDAAHHLQRLAKLDARTRTVAAVRQLPRRRAGRVDGQRHVARHAGVQPPRLPLRNGHQPRPPAALAVRLTADELDPGEAARIVDEIRRGSDPLAHNAPQLLVVLGEELGLIALYTWAIGPRIGPQRRFRIGWGTSKAPVCRAS